ncbi:MAG: Mut7-C RNAse domain-containing protein [Burkholderiales bacterium]
MRAVFRFDSQLSLFLDRAQRADAFEYDCARAATLKNAIEALGVPHTEVGALRVNGAPATLQRIVREGDYVEVETTKSGSDPDLRFVADAHLGGLARFLRMLGFDTLHRNAFSDEEIRRLAETEGRIVLTRDRELLKCREIARGAYVRALKPEAQLREVARRYGLEAHARPFSLCLACNLPLQPAERSALAARVPPAVLELHEHFVRCPGCNGVFWPGSHYRHMLSVLRSSFDALR